MLDEEHLKDAVETAASNEITLKLLFHLIEKSGCFRQGIAKDDRTEAYLRGYGDCGLYIRNLLLEYAPSAYLSLFEKELERAKNE